jgi:hypothetical protein
MRAAVSRDTSLNRVNNDTAVICRSLLRAATARADARLRIRDINVA